MDRATNVAGLEVIELDHRATGVRFPVTGWPKGRRFVLPVAGSVALHVSLVCLLSTSVQVRLPVEVEPPFVAVSLIASGGRGQALGGGQSPEKGPQRPKGGDRAGTTRSVEKKQAEVRSREDRPRTARLDRARAPALEPRPKSPPPREPRQSDSVPANSALTAAAAEPQAGAGARAGAEDLDSNGRGTGRGAGSGPGTGLGSGSGHGVGTGSGAGADLRLSCVHCPAPSYPRRAAARGIEGTVNVGFSVAADGTVREVVLRRSSGNRDLDQAAIAVARKSRFQRAVAGGSEAARGYIAYEFQLARSRR